MLRELKFAAYILMLCALLLHIILIAFFFGPIRFLTSFVYDKSELISTEAVPEPVFLFLRDNNIHLSTVFVKKEGVWVQAASRVLEWRKEKQMSQREKLAFELSFLSFNQDMTGLSEASEFYYKKPLSQLTDAQWVTLVNLHK